jgi:hypothetical protein
MAISSEAGPISAPETRAVAAVPDGNPLIVDLGRKRRKLVKQLRQGRGKLLDDVSRCIQELKESGTISGSVQPVIVVVRVRPRNSTALARLWK